MNFLSYVGVCVNYCVLVVRFGNNINCCCSFVFEHDAPGTPPVESLFSVLPQKGTLIPNDRPTQVINIKLFNEIFFNLRLTAKSCHTQNYFRISLMEKKMLCFILCIVIFLFAFYMKKIFLLVVNFSSTKKIIIFKL